MNLHVLPQIETGASPVEPVIIKVKASPRQIGGSSLSHLLTGKSPAARAFIGADLHAGRLNLVRPTLKQAAALTGANTAYLVEAARLSADERRLVDAGLRPMVAPVRHATPAIKSDVDVVADIVRRVGTDRVLEMVVAAEVAAAA